MLSALLLAPLSLSTRGARHAPPRSCAAAAGAPDEAQLALFASLRARSLEIEREVAERWREAAPVSSVPVALNDWIRRVALDWPLAACGTARGGLVLADLSSGDMLACAQDAHPSVVDTPEVRSAMRELHGEYDGNGVLSVALCGSRVASAGREGGVRLWRLDGDELVPTAELKVGALASSLLLPAGEEGPLWASFLDGSLCRWSSLGGEEPSLVVSCSAAALAAACCAPLELVAAATSAGEVELFSTRDGSPRGCWAPPEVGSARSVAFVRGEEEGWSVVVGGADGSIHRRWLREAQAAGGEAAGGAASVAAGFDEAREEEQFFPSHGGAVVGLAAAAAGLLVSGARDGTLRVWDLRRGAEERCLYGLGGYKVWLGSVCSDGARLVSDGCDNTLVLHDFSADARPDDDEIRRVGGREE